MKISTRQLITIAATIAMITVNALANILPFNGVTTAEVSNQLQSYFVPAGYVFSIWGVIYLALLAFAFGQHLVTEDKRSYVDSLFPLYLFSCFLNSIWIVLWHFGFFLTTVVVMISLLITLILIYQILTNNRAVTKKEYLLIHLPFSIYLAWICVATIANISGVLWLLNWSAFGLAGQLWSAKMMAIAGILAVTTAIKNKDLAFSFVIVWAILGIMVKFPNEAIMTYTGTATITAIIATWLFFLMKFLLKKKTVVVKKK